MTDRPERREPKRYLMDSTGVYEDIAGNFVKAHDYDALTQENEELRAEDARLRNALLTTCADYNAEAVAERDRLQARVGVLDDEKRSLLRRELELTGAVVELSARVEELERDGIGAIMAKDLPGWEELWKSKERNLLRAGRAEAKLERVREALEGEGYTDGMIAQSIAVRAALADEEPTPERESLERENERLKIENTWLRGGAKYAGHELKTDAQSGGCS